MNACERFVDRLYDEDMRLALVGDRHQPADMAAHASECAECRRAWAEAASDLNLFHDSLCETAPAGLEQRASRALRAELPARPGAPLIDWTPAATWAVVAAALAACALVLAGSALPALWQTSVVLAAALTGLSVEVTRQGLEAEGT